MNTTSYGFAAVFAAVCFIGLVALIEKAIEGSVSISTDMTPKEIVTVIGMATIGLFVFGSVYGALVT